MHICT